MTNTENPSWKIFTWCKRTMWKQVMKKVLDEQNLGKQELQQTVRVKPSIQANSSGMAII